MLIKRIRFIRNFFMTLLSSSFLLDITCFSATSLVRSPALFLQNCGGINENMQSYEIKMSFRRQYCLFEPDLIGIHRLNSPFALTAYSSLQSRSFDTQALCFHILLADPVVSRGLPFPSTITYEFSNSQVNAIHKSGALLKTEYPQIVYFGCEIIHEKF